MIERLAERLKLRPAQVQAAVDLLDGGNTMPFIARYRKEATGGLDDEQLRDLEAELKSMRALEERRSSVLAAIEALGKLTPQLRAEIEAADTKTRLEDLYAPYKGKRVTRASQAREKGLEPLAEAILKQHRANAPLEELVKKFLTPQATTVAEALAGAKDIVAERIADHAEVRSRTRDKAWLWGTITAKKAAKAEDQRGTFTAYYDFKGGPSRLRAHQILALNRGENEKVLKVAVEVPERDWQGVVFEHFPRDRRSPWCVPLEEAAFDGAERLLLPAIERDVRRVLTEQAEEHAIGSFRTNLRQLLLTPPLAGQVVLGIDPGFRTGCKLAVVDATGKVLDTGTIYPHTGQWDRARDTVEGLIRRHRVTLVVLGNGTASRETEPLVGEVLTDGMKYLVVHEAGASVYSASALAKAELPGLDVTIRGAVSLARRVLDPLAELVKIEPRSIGVGMYQHDVDQTRLGEALHGTVESVVNQVGVDVNTASPALLTYVAGIGPKLASKIVEHRDAKGVFADRAALAKVAGLGPKTFEQAAGFLRVPRGKNPLDASSIHPESYGVAQKVLTLAGVRADDPAEKRAAALNALRSQSVEGLAAQLKVGVPTLEDIFTQLAAPGRDPRAELPPPALRGGLPTMEQLAPGVELEGVVRNVVDFGAFVDLGVKQDGLLHRSQIPRGTVLSVGQAVMVKVLTVDLQRGRISLGLI